MHQCASVVFSELFFHDVVASLFVTMKEAALHVLPHPSPPVLTVHSISCFIRSYPVFSFDHLKNGFLQGIYFVMNTFEEVFDTAFTHGNMENVAEDLGKTIVGKMMGSVEVGYERGDGLTKLDSSCEMCRIFTTSFLSTCACHFMTTVFGGDEMNWWYVDLLSTGENDGGLNECGLFMEVSVTL